MTRRIIDCESCGFHGTLNYKEDDFSPSDICYCPACGGDIEEPYNLSEEDLDVDGDSV